MNAAAAASDDESEEAFLDALQAMPIDPIIIADDTSNTRKKKDPKPKRSQEVHISTGSFAGWGGISPLVKLHALAVFIRTSTIHHDRWIAIAGRSFGIDNATRWNSWYSILDIAIKKRPEIMAFLADYRGDLPNTLNDEDWDFLKNTHTFLQPFWQATLRGEKDSATLDHALSTMDLLLHWFEKSKVSLFYIYYAITYAF